MWVMCGADREVEERGRCGGAVLARAGAAADGTTSH